jgi:hypothetical protein
MEQRTNARLRFHIENARFANGTSADDESRPGSSLDGEPE